MKKLSYLLFAVVAIVLFNSCKKDNESGDYYVKIKKNGTWISYKDVAGEYGPDLGDPSYTGLVIRGQNEGATEILDIAIQNEASSIPNGSYASDNFTSTYYVNMNLAIVNGNELYSYDISDAPTRPSSKYTINITSITDDAITGSFTGNYLFDDFATTNPEVIEITEGKFRVKRIR